MDHSIRKVMRSISVFELLLVSNYLLRPVTTAAFSTTTTMPSGAVFRVQGSGVESVNQDYEWTSATIIPPGFERVCVQNRWDVLGTWQKLNAKRPWLRAASNDAYIYFNSADGQWWIDKPDGLGVYVVAGEITQQSLPPITGWRSLSPSYNPVPTLVEYITDSNIGEYKK